MERNGLIQVGKHARTGLEESFGQVGTMINASIQDGYRSDFITSAITGVANDQSRYHWNWDDDDERTVVVDMTWCCRCLDILGLDMT
ncbi:hypothetical protein Dimus_002979 [Dionaea muscipula]